jgi:hypothetical protein
MAELSDPAAVAFQPGVEIVRPVAIEPCLGKGFAIADGKGASMRVCSAELSVRCAPLAA